MKEAIFVQDLSRDRAIILFVTAVQLVSLVALALILFLVGFPLAGIALLVAVVGGAVFLLGMAYLSLRYFTAPQVREKRRLLGQLERLEKEALEVQESLAQAHRQIAAARSQAELEAVRLEESRQARLESLNEQKQALEEAREREIHAELDRLQKEHVEAGLRSVPLKIESIPGIGPVLAEKLLDSGVRTAFDVTAESVQTVAGLGEAKAQSLLWWRESFERQLLETQPVALPAGLETDIHQRYSGQLAQIDRNIQDSVLEWEQKLAAVHADEAERRAAGETLEAATRQRLEELEGQKGQVRTALEAHQGTTFLKFLSSAVQSGRSGYQARLLTLLLPTFLLFGGLLLVLAVLGLLIWMQFGS